MHSQTYTLAIQRSIPGDKLFQATTISAICVCKNTHSRVLYSSAVAQKPHNCFSLLNFHFGAECFSTLGFNKTQTFILSKYMADRQNRRTLAVPEKESSLYIFHWRHYTERHTSVLFLARVSALPAPWTPSVNNQCDTVPHI